MKLNLTAEWPVATCPVCDAEAKTRHEDFMRKQKERELSAKIVKLMNDSGMPNRFKGKGFENYQPEIDQAKQILEICMEYALEFNERAKIGQGMVLCGHTGTGKTHLACSIANKIIHADQHSVLFTSASKIFREIKETYGKNSSKTESFAIKTFTDPRLLIIDEIGVQYGSQSEINILFDIINERYERLSPTILISNLSFDKLIDYAGARVIDRMKENGGKLLVFDWTSHRNDQHDLI